MRLQKHPFGSQYLSRSRQYRLLAMVMLLGLVIFATQYASRPENWNWFFAIQGGNDAHRQPPPGLDEIDFRPRTTDGSPLPSDTFIAEAAPGETTVDAGDEPPAGASSTALPEGLLDGVEDNRVGRLRREEPALRQVLEKVRSTPEAELEKAATADVLFTVVMLHSDEYRGRLMTLTGDLHRLNPVSGPDGDGDGAPLYEAWVFTRDSGNNPYRILCVELPADLSPAQNLNRRVQVTGYFFKRYGYASQGGQHVAPMLIAKTIRPYHEPSAIPENAADAVSQWMLWGVLGIASVFGVLLWRFAASDRRFRHSRLKTLIHSPPPNPDLAALGEIDAPITFESLANPPPQEEDSP